jgi:hypothetical protein
MRAMQAAHNYLAAQGAQRAWTSGSAAVNLLRSLEPGSWSLMRRFAVDPDSAREALAGVRGGRVECWHRGRVSGVYSYDFKSSYPARYAATQVGLGLRRADPKDWRAELPNGMFLARWYWPHRRKIPPAVDMYTGAGAGHCEAWLAGEEIAAFRECGVQVEVSHGWAPEIMAPIGHVFVEEMYRQKEGGSPWAKVHLNSFHGKASENPLKTAWTAEHPDKWLFAPPKLRKFPGGQYWESFSLHVDGGGKCAPSIHPVMAAQILARARVALWRVLAETQSAGYPVYYCDTDSVHCGAPPEAMEGIARRAGTTVGCGLGELALEAGPCDAIYLGPKAYILCDSDGQIQKSALKGAPLNALKNGVCVEGRGTGKQLYRQARGGERGEDLRSTLFAEAAAYPWGAHVRKEGVTSFLWGLKQRGGSWGKLVIDRTVRYCGRGKTWDTELGGGAWCYLTPADCAPTPPSTPPSSESQMDLWES